jgi:proteasome lid subunit RPN8/RPN11
MSSVDEPIFEVEDAGDAGVLVEVPSNTMYIGAIPAEAIESDMPTLYFDFEVAKRLQFEGQRSIETDKEVAGILLGTSSADGQQIKVSHIAVARDEDSSPVHFKFTYSVWDDLIDQMESLSRQAGEELLLLGWYHTHPNMSVFLSRYDLRTHRDFHRPYQFALVIAPRLGTADTTVGFFVNRQGGTPLLPGIQMFGGRTRGEVTGALPWKFQIVEAEGIEEGTGDDEDELDDTLILYQVGVVRAEDADWLTLGDDPAEGAVTTILEGMAAAVIETRQDRIGVLLGGKTPDQHITITRVRFLGHLGEDPSKERRDLVGALRFMAQTFPASSDPKILGVVRIVSPHRFRVGDIYDPTEHNIQIAQFLKEVGYDLDEVPFQVGLVLYPGVEEDTVLFHVFAQNKMSRPVLLMSLQTLSPPSEKPNERWEPIGEPTLEIDRVPCLTPPGVVPASQIGTSLQAARMKDTARTLDGNEEAPVDGVSSGIDWDELSDERRADPRGLVVGLIVLSGLAALVAVLVVLNVLAGKEEGARGPSTLDDPAAALVVRLGEPYSWSITGCGPGWNPGVACDPFAHVRPEAGGAELLRVQRKDAYVQGTIQPIEVWLMGSAERRRHRLVREKAGSGAYSFSVLRSGEGWDAFWGRGNLPFPVTLIILPQGAELVLKDELTWLRRTEKIRIVAPQQMVNEAPTRATKDVPPPTNSSPSAGEWRWKSGASMLENTYDTARGSFARGLDLRGGSETSGSWRLRLRSSRRGQFVASATIVDPPATVGALQLSQQATALMRDPAAARMLENKEVGEKVYIHITPPGSKTDLVAVIEVTGGGATVVSTEHRVCVMMAGPEGIKLDGRARVGSGGVMRPTFDPTLGDLGECGDGGATGRWTNADFGPGPTQLEFIYEGPDDRPGKGVVQKYPLPKRWGTGGTGKCIAVTIFLDEGGFQAKAPKLTPLYGLVGGRCN